MIKTELRSDLPVVLLIDVNPRWQLEEIQERIATAETLVSSMRAVGHPVDCIYMETEELPELLFQHKAEDVIVFNLCDEAPGVPRSCALVAQKLEEFGFTFTGAGAHALEISQDKRQIMRRLHLQGISVPKWEEYISIDNVTWEYFPAIVKPAFEHCSYGITRESVVQSLPELTHRMQAVFEEFQQPVLVEEFIDGSEFHVGVIGNDPPFVLPAAELNYSEFNDIHDRLFTYESKFDKTCLAYWLTTPKMPAQLTANQAAYLNDLVTTAYQTTGCRDYARMDIRWRDDVFYFLDVNHNADIGPETSLIMGAKEVGLTYGQFGSLLVNLAARRHPVFGN